MGKEEGPFVFSFRRLGLDKKSVRELKKEHMRASEVGTMP